MSAGMAEVIAAHKLYDSRYAGTPWLRTAESASCSCGHEHGGWIDTGGEPCPDWDKEHAAHIAEELGKAGYGLLDPLAAALADPEGHALVKAIHDRKVGT